MIFGAQVNGEAVIPGVDGVPLAAWLSHIVVKAGPAVFWPVLVALGSVGFW